MLFCEICREASALAESAPELRCCSCCQAATAGSGWYFGLFSGCGAGSADGGKNALLAPFKGALAPDSAGSAAEGAANSCDDPRWAAKSAFPAVDFAARAGLCATLALVCSCEAGVGMTASLGGVIFAISGAGSVCLVCKVTTSANAAASAAAGTQAKRQFMNQATGCFAGRDDGTRAGASASAAACCARKITWRQRLHPARWARTCSRSVASSACSAKALRLSALG